MTDGGVGPYRVPVAGLRELKKVSRREVLDYCGVNGGVESYQTQTGNRALDFLAAVGLGLAAEVVRHLARAARRAKA